MWLCVDNDFTRNIKAKQPTLPWTSVQGGVHMVATRAVAWGSDSIACAIEGLNSGVLDRANGYTGGNFEEQLAYI